MKRGSVCACDREGDRFETHPSKFRKRAFDQSSPDASTLVRGMNGDLPDVADPLRNSRRDQGADYGFLAAHGNA